MDPVIAPTAFFIAAGLGMVGRGQQIRVRDESGIVSVDLANARVEGGARFDVRGRTGISLNARMTPRLAALVAKHGLGKSVLGGTVWGREFIVAAGDRVACGGRVRQDVVADASGGAGYRGTPSQLVLQPSADRPVLVIVLDEAARSSS